MRQPRGMWIETMDKFFQETRNRDVIGVACAVCGKNYCSAYMLKYGKLHHISGERSCLGCGEHMTEFRR
jgi:hypothetical protein